LRIIEVAYFRLQVFVVAELGGDKTYQLNLRKDILHNGYLLGRDFQVNLLVGRRTDIYILC
jgi:hypothetical protein